ncbi:3'-5' exonuclease [Microbacterium sp. NPDC057650]|uniref:3'-5' exonuclease n=1 Tax=unclassified Microbacterium TaxID=2609290 RepID=UPI00366EDA85
MALDFTAIDFETANSSPASPCQVGLVRVRDGEVVAQTGWLIRPPAGYDDFQEWNVRIHGIRPEDVIGAPTWEAQIDRLHAFAGGDVLVAHNAGFDLNVLRRSCQATGLDAPPYRSLCSLAVARKTYTLESYRLPKAAEAAGFGEFPHHDALADARACAQIVIDAAQRAGAVDIEALSGALSIPVVEFAPLIAERAAA